MSKLKLLLLAMMILMTSCRGTPVLIDSACSWVKPISTNKADRAVMSREVKQQIAVHNDLFDSHCPAK